MHELPEESSGCIAPLRSIICLIILVIVFGFVYNLANKRRNAILNYQNRYTITVSNDCNKLIIFIKAYKGGYKHDLSIYDI